MLQAWLVGETHAEMHAGMQQAHLRLSQYGKLSDQQNAHTPSQRHMLRIHDYTVQFTSRSHKGSHFLL